MTRTRGLRLAGLVLAWVAAAAPAAPIEDNEALVMRLIFDDCLGYVRHDRPPFRGLATRPAAPDAVARLRSPPASRVGTVELLSPRYVANWGADEDARYCLISASMDEAARRQPVLLGVRTEGFVARVSARAAKEGIAKQQGGDVFSPLALTGWYERDGEEEGVHFSLMPSDGDERTGMAEAGILVMGGPPLPRR